MSIKTTHRQRMWEEAERRGSVERFNEEIAFQLTEAELALCRYEMIDQNNRMAECVTHRQKISHGIRLHPPHLYDIRDGIVYCRENMESEWKIWKPNFQRNVESLAEAQKEAEEIVEEEYVEPSPTVDDDVLSD